MNVRPGDTWLDVGAHYGYTAIALSELVGPDGRVFAFEPMLGTVGNLAQTRTLNRLDQLTVVPFGLDDSTSIRALAVPSRRGMATPFEGGIARDIVYFTALETIWEGLVGNDPKLHGVKIDVQGMEIPALRGMRSLLNRFHPRLVVELHSGVDRPTLLSTLVECGYRPTGTSIDGHDNAHAMKYLDDHSYAFESV